MSYVPGTFEGGPIELYLQQELQRLSEELIPVTDGAMDKRHVVPVKPRSGLFYADGSDWDPGDGEGIYRYDEDTSAFILLGGGAGAVWSLAIVDFTLVALDNKIIVTPSYTGNGTTDLDFVDGGGGNDSIVRTVGSWITDGFVNGATVEVTGSASNNGSFVINSAPTATTLTVPTASLTTESNVAATVSAQVIATLPSTLVIADELVVHNSDISLAKVLVDPASHSITGPLDTVTSSDELLLAPGETAHLVARTTALMEVV